MLSPHYPWNCRLGGSQSFSGWFVDEKSQLLLAGIKRRLLSPVCNPDTLLTPLYGHSNTWWTYTNYEELLIGNNSNCVPILFNTNTPSTSQDWFLYLTDMLLILFLACSVYISVGLYWVLFIAVQELSHNFLFLCHKVPNFKDGNGQFYNMINLNV